MMSNVPTSATSAQSSLADPGMVLDHLFENRNAPNLLRALSGLRGIDAKAQKSCCDELAKCGLVEYIDNQPNLTLLGRLVAEARQNCAGQSPSGTNPGLAPTISAPRRINPFISFWRRLRQDIREPNSLEWIIVAGFMALVGAGFYSVISAPGKLEPLIFFQIASQALILIGTLYVASGVIYHPPTSAFSTVHEMQAHVTHVFIEASRHCKVGLIFFIIGTLIDFAEKSKYLEHFLRYLGV